MTVPIRPDQIGSWLDKYYAGLQVPGIAPDATAVARQNAAQAPAGATIGPRSTIRTPSVAHGALGALLSIGESLSNQGTALKQRAQLHNGYPVKDALADIGVGGVVGGLKNADAGELAGGLLNTAANLAPEAKELRAEAPAVAAPYLNFLKEWQPTSRGVFDREAPKIQGQIPSDPRLVVPAPKTDRMSTSPLVDAVLNSKTIQKGMDGDVDKGLLMGGRGWYELGPIKADLDARAGTGAMSFSDFNNLGGGSSASNSVPNELSAMSIANHARVNGLGREEAVQHFLDQTRSPVKAPLMGMHMNLGFKGIEQGTVLPGDPMSEAWKIPSYVDKRNGGGGLLDVDAPGAMPALDTHERRRLMQLVMENPRLAKVARETGAVDQAAAAKGALPLRNALDYKAISSLYTDGAKRYDLPTAGAYQAGRWTGGWDKTGLKSPPTGDFVQILEDALKYSAQRRGFDDSPAGLREYWKRVTEGKDFILPFSGKGYYPIK